jgi:hypothetical protein
MTPGLTVSKSVDWEGSEYPVRLPALGSTMYPVGGAIVYAAVVPDGTRKANAVPWVVWVFPFTVTLQLVPFGRPPVKKLYVCASNQTRYSLAVFWNVTSTVASAPLTVSAPAMGFAVKSDTEV